MAEVVATRVLVRGLVQGVGFRYWTARQAGREGVAGWVTNRPDGTVEALLEGSPDAVDRVIGWLRSGGAPSARVDAVEVSDARPDGAASFAIV